LLALRLTRHFLERLAANEIVIEFHERPVTKRVRSHVVVLNFVGLEASTQRARTFITAGREPLPIRLHLFARVDRGKRRRNPSRLERVGRVSPGAHLFKSKIRSRCHYRFANLLALLVWSPDLQSRSASH